MDDNIKDNGWKIVENEFHPEYHKLTECLMGLDNGHIGQRAGFEEKFMGETVQGSYISGIYYPEKSLEGKCLETGSPGSGKLLNSGNWIGIDVRVGAEILDLNNVNISGFRRELNMQTGLLYREFVAEFPSGKQLKVATHRFLSIADPEIGAIKYVVTSLNFSDKLTLIPFVDFDVSHDDARYNKKLWDEVAIQVWPGEGYITAEVCSSRYHVCTGMKINILRNNEKMGFSADVENRHKYIANIIPVNLTVGESVTLEKFGITITSENYPKGQLMEIARQNLHATFQKGFKQLEKEHVQAWLQRWKTKEIVPSMDIKQMKREVYGLFHSFLSITGECNNTMSCDLPEWLL